MLLFGYEQPLMPAWLDLLAAGPRDGQRRGITTTLLVTPGHSQRQVRAWLAGRGLRNSEAGREVGALRLHFLPHVTQVEFDRLLWACDLNLVRGEDSAVRALWAGQPMLWQLYPQDDGAHADKLDAFLDLALDQTAPALAAPLRRMAQLWNGQGDGTKLAAAWSALWPTGRETWRASAQARARRWAAQTDLTSSLIDWVRQRHQASRLE
jgi:uncharacterized repeat protein (TIGR03837 family)